jgi:thymidine kinase
MATLRFSFGTMGSGKSTLALQIHHNLSLRGHRGVLLTRLDRESSAISSRLGVSAPAVEVTPDTDVFAVIRTGVADAALDFVVADEAQFYEPDQVDQLARAVDELQVDVYAFGLLTDFRGRLFPGTARLLEVADERHELHVEARCWCGARATHNARLVGGHQVYEGQVVVVGDVEGPASATAGQDQLPLGEMGDDAEVTYELLCRRHWLAGEPHATLADGG